MVIEMEIDVIKMDQNGIESYVGKLEAKTMVDVDRYKVDIYTRANKNGYQREVGEQRAKAFARYIKSGGLSLNSILLCIRENVKFKPEKKDFGTLNLSKDQILWFTDGQHRGKGFGFLYTDLGYDRKFETPVVIMTPANWQKVLEIVDEDKRMERIIYEECKEFLIINKTQKGVRSDLVERKFGQIEKMESDATLQGLPNPIKKDLVITPKAIEVADFLNEDGIWKNKIRAPGDPKGDTVVRQKSFTDSLKTIITHPLFSAFNSKELSTMLDSYWSAIAELCPEAVEYPKDYLLMKTAGVFVLHALFPSVAGYCKNNELKKDNFLEVLQGMEKGMSSDYWARKGEAGLTGSSQKSFGIIESRLKKILETANATKGQKPMRLYRF
jgi:DGQHR domain-containing protein